MACKTTSWLSATLTLTSADTALKSSTLAAFWFRKQLQQFSSAGASQAVGGGQAGLLIQAALWSPQGPPDADYQLSPTLPIVRRSETAPAIRMKSPAAVRANQHCGVRVQPFTSLQHALIVAPHHDTNLYNVTLFHSPLSLKSL